MLTPLLNFRWPDILDVLFLTVGAYYLYCWFRGTKALRALIGLVALGVLYSLARFWGLFLTTWAFQILWQVVVILILILFQSEIRQVLERVSPLKILSRRLTEEARAGLNVVASAAKQMAQRGWGALIILQRRDSVTGLGGEGLPVEARISPELLVSIFNPSSPAHDGAVVIREEILERMGVVLPLSGREDLPPAYGTRHRAGLGISETTDAVAVVVSEERGQISLAVGGEITSLESSDLLEAALVDLMEPRSGDTQPWGARLKGWLTRNWSVKVGAFVLVFLIWLTMAGQQNYETSLQAPIRYIGLDSKLELGELSDKTVVLRLIGPRRLASVITEDDVRIMVNLFGRETGTHQVQIVRQYIRVPLELEVAGVTPKVLNVDIKPRAGL
jgi:uncharacterized protein (TIGR00159 family)